MKIIADEHISPKIVRAVTEMALNREWSLSSIISDRAEYRGQGDEDWIAIFARSGGKVILSADRKMLKRPTLTSKILQLNLIAIYFPSDWAQSKCHKQAAHTLHWWEKIEQTIK